MNDRNWDFEISSDSGAANGVPAPPSSPSSATSQQSAIPAPPTGSLPSVPVPPSTATAPGAYTATPAPPAPPVAASSPIPPTQTPVSPPTPPSQQGGPPAASLAEIEATRRMATAAGRPASGKVALIAGTPSPEPPPSRWGWRALAAFLAGGLLTAGGFAVGQIDDQDPEVIEVATPATGVTTDTTIGGPVNTIVPPPALATDEPVAVVARLLGPSIVQIETDVGLGSGIIYADGMILTNHHVIAEASQLRVRLPDGRTLDGTVIGSDPRTDIAVVSAGAGLGLPLAQLALSDQLEVGELTIAIGSPFQLQQTVTSGIVSAINRPIFNGTGWNAMVQTDAAINPGNSGGALANRQGQVIGINTAIQTDGLSQSNAGIGFAMPISTAYDVAERIVKGEALEPGFLGVEGQPPASGQVGVEIATVTPGSAAQEAGILVGDVVISVDGAPVTAFQELAGLIQTSFPGEQIELVIDRDGSPVTVSVVLGER